MSAEPRIPDASMRSACGPVRRENQDHAVSDAARGIFCVCDGMGGGQGGADASRIACKAASDAILPEDAFDDRILRLERGVALAHAEIRNFATRSGYWVMGTTIVALIADPASPRAAVCWAGDSRAYRFRGGALEQLTRDHTVASELARLAARGGDEVANDRSHAYAHVLTRAVGVDERVTLEWTHFDVAPGDAYLVCSDGVHDMLRPSMLKTIFAAGGTADETAKRLEAGVLAAGARDNYSFVVVRFPS